MYQAELSWNSSQIPEYREFLDKYAATRFPGEQEKAKEILSEKEIDILITLGDGEYNTTGDLAEDVREVLMKSENILEI